MSDYNQVVVVEKTENSKNVAAALNPYLKQSFCALHMFKIYFRNSVQAFNDSQSPKNLVLYFRRLV